MSQSNTTQKNGTNVDVPQVLQRAWADWQSRRVKLQTDFQTEMLSACNTQRAELDGLARRAQDSSASVLRAGMEKAQAEPAAYTEQQRVYQESIRKVEQEFADGARATNDTWASAVEKLRQDFAGRDLDSTHEYLRQLRELAATLGRDASADDVALIAQGLTLGACALRAQ